MQIFNLNNSTMVDDMFNVALCSQVPKGHIVTSTLEIVNLVVV